MKLTDGIALVACIVMADTFMSLHREVSILFFCLLHYICMVLVRLLGSLSLEIVIMLI